MLVMMMVSRLEKNWEDWLVNNLALRLLDVLLAKY